LSNTCPQTGAVRSVEASHGQVSNKPKQQRTATKLFGLQESRRSGQDGCTI
jgi:hypothetical protein